jgi:ElaB/YqjD/DUF883 family membrane-anchored ribosome-binding protein
MATGTERVLDELQHVAAELEGLLKGAADAAGESAGDAAHALNDRLARARDRLSDAEKTAKQNVERGLRTANRYVRHNAWESLGAAAALAFLAGFLLGRRD